MAPAEINAELFFPLETPTFPPGMHDYDLTRHNLIEGVSNCMISRQEAQVMFNESCETQGSHEVYTDGFKLNERVGRQRQSSTAISGMVKQPAATIQTTARQQQLW